LRWFSTRRKRLNKLNLATHLLHLRITQMKRPLTLIVRRRRSHSPKQTITANQTGMFKFSQCLIFKLCPVTMIFFIVSSRLSVLILRFPLRDRALIISAGVKLTKLLNSLKDKSQMWKLLLVMYHLSSASR
jgi:hypothetical protein